MYMNTKQNVAYDMVLFDDSKRETEKKIVPKKASKAKAGGLSMNVVVAFIAFALAMVSILYCYAQLTETSANVNTLKSQVSSAQEAEKRLMMEIEKKNDLKSIEEYARDKMGMVPIQSYQIEYIKVFQQR